MKLLPVRDPFIEALRTHQPAFGLGLPDEAIERLADYYELVLEHNPILHLVGPCSPEEFAIRHVLESLALLNYLPQGAKFADVGTGAGLPSIPCLLVREDLGGTLIESKVKKARFLAEAVKRLGLKNRAIVINRQFEEATPGENQYVTCRALDKFSEKLPRLVKWSEKRTMLLYAGDSLRAAIQRLGLNFAKELLPMSERRCLFILDGAASDQFVS